MASIMGQRAQRQGMEQQKHRDLVNEMYMESQMEKMQAETERMRPTIPYKGTMVNQADYLKLKTLENSSTTALMKEYDLHRKQAKAVGEEPMSWDEYQLQNNTWTEQYNFYALQEDRAGRKAKEFSPWMKEQRKSSATRISTGEVVDRAGKTTAARLKATAESEALGADLYNQAVKNLGFSYELEEDPELRDKMLAGEMEKLLGQTFGPKNVSPLLEIPGKGRGFKIRKSDGKTVWKGISK